MKIIAQCLVYNEGDYLEAAIRPWLDVCERISIFEGGFQTTLNLGYPPRSQDGTIEIARKLENENPSKVTLTQHNEWNEPILRNNHLYQVIKEFGREDTFLFILDGDEVYSPEDVKRCVEQINNDKETNTFWINMRNYVNDDRTSHLGFRVPRFFRLEKAVGFSGYNDITFADGLRAKDIKDVLPRHFSWMPLEKAKRKMEWQARLGWTCSWKLDGDKLVANDEYFTQTGKQKPIFEYDK